jgi:hypothetical protein
VGAIQGVALMISSRGIYVIKNGQQTTLVQRQGGLGHWRIVYKVFAGGHLLMSASDETPDAFTRGSVGIAMGTGKLDNFRVCQYSQG